MDKLTHINSQGRARMVDVSCKNPTARCAVASGIVRMQKNTAQMIKDMKISKGDVLSVAQVAGIQAAKNTWSIVPMAHQLLLKGVDITFQVEDDCVKIRSCVKCTDSTGVEMEALVAVSAAALCIYDMCKAVDRAMVIERVQLEEKSGGASGHFIREEV